MSGQKTRASEPIVGNYKIISRIGEGGFGKTYKAEHLLSGNFACFKHCSRLSAEGNRLLKEEAKTMWDLHCDGLPAIRDLISMPNGNLALIMSYIPGPTLEQSVIEHGPFTPESVCRIAQRILHTLCYLHVQAPVRSSTGVTFHGVIHGDLSPKNIILQISTTTFNVFLVDFGLARVNNSLPEPARGSRPIFSPHEQLTGRELVPASDLYTLGITMIYALTGDMKATAEHQIPVTVPKPLRTFITRLLAEHPYDRPHVWDEEDLCTTIRTVRQESFGRIYTPTALQFAS